MSNRESDVRPKHGNHQGLALFADRKFGLFIHWGLYSILGRGEWVQRNEKIPPAEYEALRHQFKGEKFDADAIARLALEAGMKYITITTKHHDGFCLFDSALTDYTTAKSAPKRDFIGEISEACHRHGLGFHPYYSLWDWHHPDFVPEDPQRFRRYLDYYHGQVRELCTRYGQVDGFWFDCGGGPGLDKYELPQVGNLIHGLHPGAAVMCVDYWVAEKSILSDANGQPRLYGTAANNLNPGLFEICETLNGNYAYCPGDTNFKSVPYLCRYLVEIVGHGGNLLLNVGPQPDGSLDAESVRCLQGMGRWLKKYGEAIYGTWAALHPRINPLGHTLVRDNQVYYFLKDLTPLLDQTATDTINPLDHGKGTAEVQFYGLMAEVESIQPVGSVETLIFSQEGMNLRVKIPRSALDWPLMALKVQTKGPARLAGDIMEEADGSYRLSAEWAAIFSPLPREPQLQVLDWTPDTTPQIWMWVVATTKLAWRVQVKQAGRFRVVVEQACGAQSPTGRYEVRFRGGSVLHASSIIDHSTGQAREAETQGMKGSEIVLQAQVRTSGTWDCFTEVTLGEVGLPEGTVCVDLVPHFTGSYEFMHFRNLRLVPAGSDANI